MHLKKRCLIVGVLLLLGLSGIATPFMRPIENKEKDQLKEDTLAREVNTFKNSANPPSKFRKIDNKLLHNKPTTNSSPSQTFHAQGTKWENDPGNWWDTSWEYRQNVTITEPNVVAREKWPVDVYIHFTPPAHHYSIRVIDSTGNPIAYQPWNITRVNETYLEGCTISFMVDLGRDSVKTFQIYWSISEKSLPNYGNALEIDRDSTPAGTKYTISSTSLGWAVTLPPQRGGTTKNLTHQSGNKIGHSEWLNFGISRNPSTSYEGYWGTGNTSNTRYDWRGIVETKDALESQFQGDIFATYKVVNVPFYSSEEGTDIAEVTYTYRFYRWGWTVNETISWPNGDTGNYWMNGWVFDQDDGESFTSNRFNYVSTNPSTGGIQELSTPIVETVLDESFEDGNLDPWTSDNNGGVSTDTSNTGSYSAYHNAQAGSVTSSSIDLTPYGKVNLSFWVRQGGNFGNSEEPESGEDLVVEYYNANGNWVELPGGATFLGADPGGTIYERSYTLPSDAFHQDFQLRFRQTAGSGSSWYRTYDWWHFDDVELHGWSASDSQGESLNYTAFMGPDEGIGRVWLENSSSQVSISSEEWRWYNEIANDFSSPNYLSYMKDISLHADTNGYFTSKYATIPWSPSGSTPSDRFGAFNDTRESLWNPLTVLKASKERFKLRVTVTVQDKDRSTIAGAGVRLEDGAIANYSGYTDSAGNITFNVKRTSYDFHVNVTSGGQTYVNTSISQAYNTIPYTEFSGTVVVTFSQLVKLKIHAQTSKQETGSESDLQNGQVVLQNVSQSSQSPYTISRIAGTTNLTGWYSAIIPNETWELAFNYTTTDTERWDNFTLTHYPNEGPVKNSIGDTTGNGVVNFTSINITTWQTWNLTDLDITTAPDEAELVWSETPNANPYWGENITGEVILRDEDTKDRLTGTVEYRLMEGTNVFLQDSGATTSDGTFSFTINVGDVWADATYSLYINATLDNPGGYNEPSPLERTLTVDLVPTSLSISIAWGDSGSYWDERLEITLEYINELEDIGVPSATVEGELVISGFSNTFLNSSWNAQSRGVFTLTFPHFHQFGPGSYSLRVDTGRGNFTSATEVKSLAVNERPTTLSTLSYINIPWTYNYTFQAEFTDDIYDVPVTNQTYSRKRLESVSYDVRMACEIKNETGAIKTSPMYYWTGNNLYNTTISINGSDLAVGTYTLTVSAGKKGFENDTIRTTLEITERATDVLVDPARVEEIYGNRIEVQFSYQDTDYETDPFGKNSTIYDATRATYTIGGPEGFSPIQGNLTFYNGSYFLNISTETINNTGTFSIYAGLKKSKYEEQSPQVTLIINEIPTSIQASKKEATKYWGNNVTIDVDWNNSVNESFISDATLYKWNTSDGLEGKLKPLRSTYIFELNTSLLSVDNATYIHIHFQKPFREPQTLTITIDVKPIPTVASVSRREISTYWGALENVTAMYNRSQEYRGILDPIISADVAKYTIFRESGANLQGTLESLGNGKYGLIINTSELMLKTYTIELKLGEAYHASQEVTITISIKGTPTDVLASSRKLEVYWGEMADVNISWLYGEDTFFAESGSLISHADNHSFAVYQGKNRLLQGNLSEIKKGVYSMQFNTTKLDLGVFSFNLFLKQSYTENQSVIVSLTVKEIPTYVSYPKQVSVVWGDPASFEIEVVNTLTEHGVENVSKEVLALNQSFSTNLTELRRGRYLFNISTYMLEGGRSYGFQFNLSKPKFEVAPFYIELSVKSLSDSIEITYEEIDTEIKVNPATFGVSNDEKQVIISAYDQAHQRVLEGAEIKYTVVGLTTGFFERGSVPGRYVALIDWSQAKAGAHYRIQITVESLTFGGKVVNLAQHGIQIQGPLKGVNVDYWGGSIALIGFRVPNVWFFTGIGSIFAVSVFASIRLYNYLTTPPEVRELEELIENVEKGDFEYPMITREEMYEEDLKKMRE